ncbi:MAG: DUF3786 domain-containing protein [Thermodesulfobacteriota bacterium]
MSCAAPNQMHWDDLAARSRDEILGREGVKEATPGSGYEVAFLDALYRVDPIAQQIVEISPKPDRPLTEEFQILIIRYLVAPNGGPVDHVDASEKDFPGGVTFFQGPHALHVRPIVRRYGQDPDAFVARGRQLGGLPVAYGDKAMRFEPFPQIPVTYVLWKADDEFPASVSVLFDKSIARWFELDMIFTLVWVLTERILEGDSA